MKKIIFGITGLTLGGAERTLVDVANRLSYRYDITIFCLYAGGELEKELSNKIKIIHLCKKRFDELTNLEKRYMSLKILLNKKYLYRTYICNKFDKEIAFLEGPITRLFAADGNKKKKIAWVHNDISKVFGNDFKSKMKSKFDKRAYKKYGQLVFVSEDNLKKFNKKYKIKNEKHVIYNFIERDNVLRKSSSKLDIEFSEKSLNFVTVARLVKQKAFGRLVKVHSRLIKEGLEHHFYVVGDGPKREMLERKIKEENVQSTFHLLGKKENPYPYIKEADYFCLLTYFEGYPMVLEEAKILGKNILITDTAARETVQNYENAKIFDNTEEGIYEGLKDVLESKNKQQNSLNTKEYDNRKIIDDIIKIIEK